jgi:hypothetical protein
MGNELTTKNNNYVASTEDYFAMVAGETSQFRDGGGMNFMKFDGNTGEFSYGANNEELALGTLLALNIPSYRRGFICWKDGKPVDEIMVSVTEGAPPRKTELPDHGPYEEEGDGWSEQYTIEMRMMEDPHLLLQFQANNASKRRAFEKLMKDFARQFREHPECAPVIEIDEVEFETKGKSGKRNFKKHAPVFKIIEWAPIENLDALVEGSPDDYESDEDDRAPPARSRARRDAESDERPARVTNRRARDEEDEPPARSARRSRDEEEETETRPSRARSRDADEVEDGEDEAPPRRSARSEPVSRGRGRF